MQNNPIKTIFVCEFITGGGLHHSDLPHELAFQGELMRNALLSDLSLLDYQVRATVDARLTAPAHCNTCSEVHTEDDPWQIWDAEIQQSDAVWLIAPETDGYLERMTTIASKHNKMIIGCGTNAVKAFSSKYNTYQLLEKSGIATLPTVTFQAWVNRTDSEHKTTAWVAKPNDGAGCEETVCFTNADSLMHWIIQNNKQETHIIQPYFKGDAASITCVIHQGKARLLSCNQQLIAIEENQLHYKGCIVNGLYEYWEAFEHLANEIAVLLPDIAGYVGIDLIVNDAGKQLTVVEVNPRLTTSYIALNEATGVNPAELIMNTFTQEDLSWPSIEKNVVKLEMMQRHE